MQLGGGIAVACPEDPLTCTEIKSGPSPWQPCTAVFPEQVWHGCSRSMQTDPPPSIPASNLHAPRPVRRNKPPFFLTIFPSEPSGISPQRIWRGNGPCLRKAPSQGPHQKRDHALLLCLETNIHVVFLPSQLISAQNERLFFRSWPLAAVKPSGGVSFRL